MPLKGKAVMPKVINLRGRLDVDVPTTRHRNFGRELKICAAEAIWIVRPVDSDAVPLGSFDPQFPLVIEGNDGFGKAPKILPGDLFGLPQVGPHVGVAAMGEGEGRGPVNQSLDAGDRA